MLVANCRAQEDEDWRPLDPAEDRGDGTAQPRHFINSDPCTLHKVVMHQDNYYQVSLFIDNLPPDEYSVLTVTIFHSMSSIKQGSPT